MNRSRTRYRLLRASSLTVALLALIVIAGSPTPASAQLDSRQAPSAVYFHIFNLYYEGDYADALKEFRSEGRGAIKTAAANWIDSICYHTMCGECYYHMGQLDQALASYTSALQLYVAYPDWMLRVKFDPTIRPSTSGQVKTVPWGQSQRQFRLGHYPAKVLTGQGRINNNDIVQKGGVFQSPVLYPISPQEIVRCTCLALRRRAELMGPVAAEDRLTADIITALSRRPAPANHWSEAWIDVQLGLAYLNGGKIPQAKAALNRSLVAGGQYDHPLTSTALLELGKLAIQEENFAAATTLLAEATYSAFHSEDVGSPDIIDEAFRYGLIAHMMTNDKVIYPPLEAAAEWARRRDLTTLQTSVLLMAAENLAALGNTAKAESALDSAWGQLVRREMRNGVMGARHAYAKAQVNYQRGRSELGDKDLAEVLKFQQQASHWVFQIGLTDKAFVAGQLTDRKAMDLYDQLLRDPTPVDWMLQPLESLSVLAVPHPQSLENWFFAALERREHERALEISDLAKRHRFYSSLPLGGRLLSLRWVLEAPENALSNNVILERQKLLAKFPAYAQASQEAARIKQQLDEMPLVADTGELGEQQAKLLEQLTAVCLRMEAMLREIAVRREAASLVFPPRKTAAELSDAMPDGTGLIDFFMTRKGLFAFIITNDKKEYAYWQIGNVAGMNKKIADFLREMGNVEANRGLRADDLESDDWRQDGQLLLKGLFAGANVNLSEKFDELVIVPDGTLWYLPFEALQVDLGEQSASLLGQMKIRYVPLASLAVGDPLPRRAVNRAAVVVGKMYPGQAPEVANAAWEQFARSLPGASRLPERQLPGSSLVYSSLFDRLIVLDEVLTDEGPYAWSPARIDKGTPGSTIHDWLALPWEGPEQIVLPAFHTAAERSLKSVRPDAAGAEIFLNVCAMMAGGTRTALISRWRTGGQTSYDLVREFAQEVPYTSAADAWQRSVLLSANAPLDPEFEPRLSNAGIENPPRARHPFFWAGYMLVDTGTTPTSDEEPMPADDMLGGE